MTLNEKIQKKAEGYGKLAPAFLEGAEFALNNRWISIEEDLPYNHEEMWLSRDEDGTLCIFTQKPTKLNNRWAGILGTRRGDLPRTMFPEVKWTDEEPTKVKLIIDK